jgi:hypothetical protein
MSPQEKWPWPETSQLEGVTKNWIQHRDQNTATYVYYGAIPAFRYYLNILNYETNNPPATWMQECAVQNRDRSSFCQDEGIYYSSWNRHRPIEYKIQNILGYVENRGNQFWLVFSHIYDDEQIQILENLSPIYSVVHAYQDTGAEIYLLQRNEISQ